MDQSYGSAFGLRDAMCVDPDISQFFWGMQQLQELESI